MPSFHCPNCSQPIEAPENLVGTMIECPSCKTSLTVPRVPATASPTLTDNPYSPPNSSPPASFSNSLDSTAAAPASFLIRVGAHIIDGIVTYILAFVVGFIVGTTLGAALPPEALQVFGGLAGMVSSWLYYALMESGPNQATLGKMACGLIVTDLQGQRVGFGKATGRYFGMIVSSLILGIGFLMCAWTERKQCLHDMMAGCLVLKK